MKLWIDAQLSPRLAWWLTETFSVEALAVRDLGLREAKDLEIYDAAREAGAVVVTKDSDFVLLQARLGPPPRILWITCGNTSNAYLMDLLASRLPEAFQLLGRGEDLVEIGDRHKSS